MKNRIKQIIQSYDPYSPNSYNDTFNLIEELTNLLIELAQNKELSGEEIREIYDYMISQIDDSEIIGTLLVKSSISSKLLEASYKNNLEIFSVEEEKTIFQNMFNYNMKGRGKIKLSKYVECIPEEKRELFLNMLLDEYKIGWTDDESEKLLFLEEFNKLLELYDFDIIKKYFDKIVQKYDDADPSRQKLIKNTFVSELFLKNFDDHKDDEMFKKYMDTIMQTENEKIILTSSKKIQFSEGYANQMIFLLDKMSDFDETKIVSTGLFFTIEKFIKSGKFEGITEEQIKKINEKYEHIREKIKEPNLEKYNEVKDFSEMDEKKFDEFISDLEKYCVRHGEIPEKYCDYLFKLKIEKGSFISKNPRYTAIFQKAYESKGQAILKEKGITDVLVFCSKSLSDDKHGGYYSKSKNLVANEIYVNGISRNDCSAINTLFHEIRHAVQYHKIENDEFLSFTDYLILKEEIIGKIDKDFYKTHYRHMANEADARINGSMGQKKYLDYLGFSGQEIYERVEGGKERSVYGYYKRGLREEIKAHLQFGKVFKVSNFEKRGINELFGDVLKYNPDLLKKYPILKFEYDDNGERRPSLEILMHFDSEFKKLGDGETEKIKLMRSLMIGIISEKPAITNKRVLEDSRLLLLFESDNPIINMLKNKVIKNELLDVIEKKSASKKLKVEDDETKEESEENFKELVGNLYKYAISRPEEKISKEIIEKLEEFMPELKQMSQSEITALAKNDENVSPSDRKAMEEKIKQSKKKKEDNDIDVPTINDELEQ